MKCVIFTICLMGLFLFFTGCSDSSAKRKSRLDFNQPHRTKMIPFSTPGVTGFDLPRIRPMELPPKKTKAQSSDQSQLDPFAEWPSPLQQKPEK